MKVYQIGPDGLYAGSIDADPNPRRPGHFIIPAGCVTAAPPKAPGKRARYTESGWQLEDIPVPPLAPEPAVPPEKNQWDHVRERANFLLVLADRHIAEAVTAGAVIPPAWTAYRTELSALAEAETGDAETVTWPDGPPPIGKPETPDTLEGYAAARRHAIETGGVMLAGARIDTSRESQSLITSAYALSQTTGDPVDFKAETGFVTLSPAEMKAIAVAAGRHVQACFTAEKQVLALIASGEIATREQIDAYPWPSGIAWNDRSR